ncbi:MAG: DEAD/DEAH box helicase family protein, partial [Gammaproteobacteria bacterium]
MSSVLPQPPEFGLPDKFKEWRPHQESAILSITDTSNDVMHRVLVCPTGFGKSLMYVGAAHMSGMRTCILTSTKALQDQLVSDFGSIGVVDIRGKNNYKCLVVDGSADHGPCGAGEECSYRKSGCPFYDQLRKAMGANIVVTNYAFWLTLNAFSHNDNMGIFDMLVMDEAHNTPDQLMSFLEVQVPKYLVPNPYKDMINTSKKHNPSKLDWSAWLSTVEVALSDTITDEKSRWNSDKSKLVKLRRLVLDIKRAIYNLDNNPDDWEWEIDSNGYSVRFAPITPGKATDVLFSNVTKQYIYTSATVNHKTMEMLGLHKHNYYNSNGDAAFDECDEYSLVEYPHTFPVDNRRVTHIKTVRLDRRSTSGEIGMWLLRINQIVKWRLDRKGIIHTVSYSRMKMVVESLQRDRDISKSGIKIWYHDSKGAAETILRFKHS